MQTADNRRPIAARSARWAEAMARTLARAGVSANAISVASVVFALGAAAALLAAPARGATLFLIAAGLIPLRLLANLLDGMVALEHGKATPLGPLYNEVPDRIADVAVLAAAGASAAAAARLGSGADVVAAYGAALGWLAAVAALGTAYVRELGRALGGPADFCGPFAKQQRMVAIAVGAAVASFEPAWGGAGEVVFAATALVALGTLLTVWRRLARLCAFLRENAQRTTESEGEGRLNSPRET